MTQDPGAVERLVATEEIRQLAYRYAYAQDSRDANLLLSLWHETPEPVEYPRIDVHTVRRDHQRWFAKGPSIHFIGNHLIDFAGPDRASGRVYCWCQIDFEGEWIEQMILYQDRYLREGGRWLFEWRRHLLWYGQARERHPLDQPADQWPLKHTGRGSLPAEILASRPAGEPG